MYTCDSMRKMYWLINHAEIYIFLTVALCSTVIPAVCLGQSFIHFILILKDVTSPTEFTPFKKV